MKFTTATLISLSLTLLPLAATTPLLQKRCSDAAVQNSEGKPAHAAAVQACKSNPYLPFPSPLYHIVQFKRLTFIVSDNDCVAATGSSGTTTTGTTTGGTDYSSPSYWNQWWSPSGSSSSAVPSASSSSSTAYGEECGKLNGDHWQPWTWHQGCEQYVPEQDGISCCGTPCGTYPGGCVAQGS